MSPAATDSLVSNLRLGFGSGTAAVNRTSLRRVRCAAGPRFIFLHGFPRDRYEFDKTLSGLEKKFTVIAVDRGHVNGSVPASSGYEAANLSPDQPSGALETNRAFSANGRFNATRSSRVGFLPFLAPKSTTPLRNTFPKLPARMRARGLINLETEVIPGSAHYVANETPDLPVSRIEKYATT